MFTRWSIRICILMGIFQLQGPQSWAMGPARSPRLVVALGDSITAGTFAHPMASGQTPPQSQKSLAQQNSLRQFDENGSKVQPVDLLSWIKGMLSRMVSDSRYSWASGRRIDSHLQRVRRSFADRGDSDVQIDAVNFAVPGSSTLDAMDQLQRLRRKLSESGNSRIEYVVATIGSNDACFSKQREFVPEEDFENHLRSFLRELSVISRENGRSRDQPLHVLLSGIPPIPTMSGKHFLEYEKFPGITCKMIRDQVFNFCTNLLGDAESFVQRMEWVQRRNEIIERLIRESNEEAATMRAAFGKGVTIAELEPELLALDCFHPNTEGQYQLSEVLWRDQPWY